MVLAQTILNFWGWPFSKSIAFWILSRRFFTYQLTQKCFLCNHALHRWSGHDLKKGVSLANRCFPNPLSFSAWHLEAFSFDPDYTYLSAQEWLSSYNHSGKNILLPFWLKDLEGTAKIIRKSKRSISVRRAMIIVNVRLQVEFCFDITWLPFLIICYRSHEPSSI